MQEMQPNANDQTEAKATPAAGSRVPVTVGLGLRCGLVGLLGLVLTLVLPKVQGWLQYSNPKLALVLLLVTVSAGAAAILCGYLGRHAIGKSHGTLTGTAEATAGMVLGYVAVLGAVASFVLINRGGQYPSDSGRCLLNLVTIAGAKEQWALDHLKRATAEPSWEDLVGPEKYLATKPSCPGNGVYILGNLVQVPYCTHHVGLIPGDSQDLWKGIVEVVDGQGRPKPGCHIVLFMDRTQFTNHYREFGGTWMPVWHDQDAHIEISRDLRAPKGQRLTIPIPDQWPVTVVVE